MSFKTDTAKIKRWREERHWSQEHLAELAGVGLRTLQRIENGQQASAETLKALANAFQVDAMALSVDSRVEAAEMIQSRNAKATSALRLSFLIHLVSYLMGMTVFTAINLETGYFVMKSPMLWWTVGLMGHAVTVAIVELVARYNAPRGRGL